MIIIKYHKEKKHNKMEEKLKPRKTSNANEKQLLITNQPILSLFLSSSAKPDFPLLYMQIMMPYSLEQPFGQLGSAALTVSPPGSPPAPWLAGDHDAGAAKSLA